MNYVLAHVKGHARKKTFKLLSDTTLFDTSFDGIDFVPYVPDHNLDSDAWFAVDEFSKKNFCIELLQEKSTSADFDDLKQDQFSTINYLCAVQKGDYFFQKISPSQFVKRKMVTFGECAKVSENKNQMVIKDDPDAVYLAGSDQLVFKSLATISSIFKGIDLLYKAATDAQVNAFLGKPFISLANGYGLSNVSKPNRQRIALAMETLAQIKGKKKDQMIQYIHEYSDKTLTYDRGAKKFEISSDNDLKMLLYGVEQRFYTTRLGRERRLANSVQKID